MPWKTEGGFNIGEINLKGIGEYESETYRILIKNENMVGYKNDKVNIMIPDLICMIGEDSGVITTPNFWDWKKDVYCWTAITRNLDYCKRTGCIWTEAIGF